MKIISILTIFALLLVVQQASAKDDVCYMIVELFGLNGTMQIDSNYVGYCNNYTSCMETGQFCLMWSSQNISFIATIPSTLWNNLTCIEDHLCSNNTIPVNNEINDGEIFLFAMTLDFKPVPNSSVFCKSYSQCVTDGTLCQMWKTYARSEGIMFTFYPVEDPYFGCTN
jgi:hypothetical protein